MNNKLLDLLKSQKKEFKDKEIMEILQNKMPREEEFKIIKIISKSQLLPDNGVAIKATKSYIAYTFDLKELILNSRKVTEPFIIKDDSQIKKFLLFEFNSACWLITIYEDGKAIFNLLEDSECTENHLIERNVVDIQILDERTFAILMKSEESLLIRKLIFNENHVEVSSEILQDNIPEANSLIKFKDTFYFSNSNGTLDLQNNEVLGKNDSLIEVGDIGIILTEEEKQIIVKLIDENMKTVNEMKFLNFGACLSSVCNNNLFLLIKNIMYVISIKNNKLYLIRSMDVEDEPLGFSVLKEDDYFIYLLGNLKNEKKKKINIKLKTSKSDSLLNRVDLTPKVPENVKQERKSLFIKDDLRSMSSSDLRLKEDFEEMNYPKFKEGSDSFEFKGNKKKETLKAENKTYTKQESLLVNEVTPKFDKNQLTLIDHIAGMIERLNLKLLEDSNERDSKERRRQDILLGKISDQLNSNLSTVVETAVRKEVNKILPNFKRIFADFFDQLEKNLLKMNERNELIKTVQNVMLNNVVPAVESCVEEMKLQVVSEVKNFSCFDYGKDAPSSTAEVKIYETDDEKVLSCLARGDIELAAEHACRSPDSTFELFVDNVDLVALESVYDSTLLKVLERAINVTLERGNNNYNELLKSILGYLTEYELREDELNIFKGYITRLSCLLEYVRPEDPTLKIMVDFQRKCYSKKKSRINK